MKNCTKFLCYSIFAFILFLLIGCTNDKTINSTTKKETTKEKTTMFDYSKFKNYKEINDCEYKFDFDEIVTPYFTGNVIYNETVLLIKENGTIKGKLQYKPLKILSIRDYTWKNEFDINAFSFNENEITLLDETKAPFLTHDELIGNEMKSKYKEVTSITNVETDIMRMAGTLYTESDFYYGNQIQVSYVYDVKDLDLDKFPKYDENVVPRALQKLNNKEDLKIVFLGDSVSEGCSSSKHFKHEPYLDNFVDLFGQALNEKYEGTITIDNQSVGGKTATWGSNSQQINKVIEANPDVLYIHFGVNDLGGGSSPNGFIEDVESIILGVQAFCPDVEIIVVAPFGPNSISYNYDTLRKYVKKIEGLSESIDNVYTLNMFDISDEIYKVKSYYDITGNGINHLNDYSSRLYAMCLLSQFIDYSK